MVWATKLWRDVLGSMLVEYTVVFPVFMLVTLGTVDVAYMLSDYALANKAAYLSARYAIVSNPAATNITDPSYTPAQLKNLGLWCFDKATGTPNGNCPTSSVVCSGLSGNCNNPAFADIVRRAQAVSCIPLPSPYTNCRLQAQNVTVSYTRINSLGFVGQPMEFGGIPTTVTVGISNVPHQFFFLGGIMGFFGGGFANRPIPDFATTLTSEDLTTN